MPKVIGVDLGTANTLVFVKNKGIVLREPSVVAVDNKTKKVVAVGDDAKRMIGKTPGSIVAKHPLKDGVIADFDMTAKMLHSFFAKANASGFISRKQVAICIPYGVTEVERRAVEDATWTAGANDVALIDEPLAAAIGSGLKINVARGSMIVDIGGGTTEVAVLSLNGIVISHSSRAAGNQLDEAIINYMKREFHMSVGEGTAEMLKKNIGSAHPSADRGSTEVRGRSLRSGLAVTQTVTSTQMREAMQEPLEQIISTIRQVLENTPPELSSDILDYGIMLSGGGALLAGLSTLISERTGIRVTVAKKPLESVCIGIGRAIENPDLGLVNFRTK